MATECGRGSVPGSRDYVGTAPIGCPSSEGSTTRAIREKQWFKLAMENTHFWEISQKLDSGRRYPAGGRAGDLQAREEYQVSAGRSGKMPARQPPPTAALQETRARRVENTGARGQPTLSSRSDDGSLGRFCPGRHRGNAA